MEFVGLMNEMTYTAYFVAEPSALQALSETLHEHLGLQAPYLVACPSSGRLELHADLQVQIRHPVASWHVP
jgi:hypothetical protein